MGSRPGTSQGTAGQTSTAETFQSICQSVRKLPSPILLNFPFSMTSLQLLNMLSTYLIIRKIHRWVIGDYFWVLLHLKTADISRPFSFIFPIYIIRITITTYYLFYISLRMAF